MHRRRNRMGGLSSSLSSESRSLEEDAKQLRKELRIIHSRLEEEEKIVAEEMETQKLLVKNLWTIFYDGEDALQGYDESRIADGEPPTGGCVFCRGEERSNCRNPCTPCIHDRIRRVLKDISDLSRLQKSLRFGGTRRKTVQARIPTGSLSGATQIYEMEEDKNYLVELLLSPSNPCLEGGGGGLIVFPVIGAGGTGKSTLVRHVYNDKGIAKCFAKKGWVSCDLNNAHESNVLKLLNPVLQWIGAKSVGDDGQISAVEQRMRENLKEQRFLLVIDDACYTSSCFWETFWSPIVNVVAEGSVAIVIAQRYEVLEAMPLYLPRIEPYNLFPLDFDDCWSIFKSTMKSLRFKDYHSLEDDEDDLTKIGKQIVKKYQGFPKAIKSAAYNLHRYSDPESWNEHLKEASCDSFYLASYRLLSLDAKRCLLYCTLFPEGYVFDRDYLIRLWTAEGFLRQGKSAIYQFKQLLNNFFFLHREFKYEMPIVVHDLLLRDTDFFCRIDDGEMETCSPSELRHMSFAARQKEAHLPQNPKTLLQLRSFLTFYGKVSSNIDFQGMGNLRTLELSYTDVKTLPASIVYLRNLRFLGLNGTLIEALPDSVCTLYKLQVLELEFCRKLLGFPKGLEKLTNLERLPIFKIGEVCQQYSGLQELAKLVNLRNELSIWGLHHASNEELGSAYLVKMQFLKDLKLFWSSSPFCEPEYQHLRREPKYLYSNSRFDHSSMKKEEQVIERLMPHAELENLTIQSYSGRVLPKWMAHTSFRKMKFINLKDCLNCISLPSLGRLPVLKRLVINCPAVGKIDDQFCGGSDSFPSLEELILVGMLNLEEWIGVKKDDFKKLKELQCVGCPRLKGIPQIPSVESLKIENCREVEIASCFTSLQDLQICSSVFKDLPQLTSLVNLTLMHCQCSIRLCEQPRLRDLWVEDCGWLELDVGVILTDLVSLFVANCYHDIVLPPEVKEPSYSRFRDGHTLSFMKNTDK